MSHLSYGEDTGEVLSLLRSQQECMKKQLFATRMAAGILLLVIAVIGIGIAFAAPRFGKIMSEVETSSKNLAVVSEELAKVNMPVMIENVNELISNSNSAIIQATEDLAKIDFETLNKSIGDLQKIDLETLNKAISDLQKIIEPLASFFK